MVGPAGREGGMAKKKKEGEVGMDLVKDGWRGLRDGQCRQFSLKQHQRYTPEVARLVHMSSSFFSFSSFVAVFYFLVAFSLRLFEV